MYYPDPTRRRSAHVVSYVVAALIFAIATFLPSTEALGVENGTFSVEPWGNPENSQLDDSSRAYFVYSLHPGETITDWVAIGNTSDKRLSFSLYGADAYNLEESGAFTLRAIDHEMSGVGTWFELGESAIALEPGTRAVVPFTLTVPRNAPPGDHSGGLVAVNLDLSPAEGNASIAIQSAIGSRVYVRVLGDTKAELAVTGVSVQTPQDDTRARDITYTVTNTGNVRLSPNTGIRAEGLFGRQLLSIPSKNLNDLLPGESVTATERWDDVPDFDRAVVVVTAAQGTIESSASKTTWIVSFRALVGAVLVVALLAAWIGLRRWRRSPDSELPTQSPEQPLVDA